MKMLISEKTLLELSEKVVSTYYRKGVIPKSELEDAKMELVERFLQQQERLANSFEGKARVSTFCVAVLNNYCREYIRKAMKLWKREQTVDEVFSISPAEEAEKNAVISDEVAYLGRVMALQGDISPRLHVELTYFFDLVMPKFFLQAYDEQYIKHKLEALYEQNVPTKSEKYMVMAEGIKRAEKQKMKPDAVRMRFQKSMKLLIDLMNSPCNRAFYSKESFHVLYEYYYNKLCKNKSESHE